MPPLVFPDNTVLCNFASVNRLELLEGWLRGRGRWTAAVAYEVGRSTTVLPALASIGRLAAPRGAASPLSLRTTPVGPPCYGA